MSGLVSVGLVIVGLVFVGLVVVGYRVAVSGQVAVGVGFIAVGSSKLRGHYLLLSPKVGGAHLVIIFT